MRAFEAGRVSNIQRVRVDIVIDALGDTDIAIEELAEEFLSGLLLEYRRLGLQGTTLLVTGTEMPCASRVTRACVAS